MKLKTRYTRIHGKSTWEQVENLHEESEDIAMKCDVSYTWSDEHGLPAEIMGAVKYLALTTLTYAEPTKPAHQHAGILANTSQHIAHTLT